MKHSEIKFFMIRKSTLVISMICIATFSFFLSSCVMGGTHGSIKSYNYPVDKNSLQAAVEKVIATNNKILGEDTAHNGYIIDITNGKNDTIPSYNRNKDGTRYVSVRINVNGQIYEYTIQYVGTQNDWQLNTTSTLSIAYAYDNIGNGGSDGNGGMSWYRFALRKKMLSIFEKEIIERLDKELKTKHT